MRKEEREQRIRDYKAVMTIMKKRGERAPEPAGGVRRRAIHGPASAAAVQPLQIFAEGDSWFDYPVPFFGGGIIPRLEDRLGVPILNMAEAGDEVRFMLGVEQRKRLIKTLTDGCPAGGPWDAMLFSGGGNDIVGNPLALWLNDFVPGAPATAQINQQRYSAAVALVRAAYEDLVDLRNKLSPGTHILFHDYDFALPDGRGICFLGPWLKPAFDLHRFPTLADGAAVVQEMLTQFAAMLMQTAAQPKVTLVKTQRTLVPQPSSWHNELHPAKAGFNTFANMFRQELKAIFPNRIP